MSRGESFDLTLAKACAKAFATACEVGCVVSDATGEVKYENHQLELQRRFSA